MKEKMVPERMDVVDAEIENFNEDENRERGNWSSKLDFLLSSIGLAVGFGNVWRFPYLCYRNGGGAFLIPYATFLFLCAMPMMLMEYSYGQFSGLGPIAAWKISPLFKGVGYGMVMVSGIVSVYYNVIIAWSLYYLLMSFRAELPWSTCGNEWNNELCFSSVQSPWNQTFGMNSAFPTIDVVELMNMGNVSIDTPVVYNISTVNNVNNTKIKMETPSEQYWQNHVLQNSGGIHHMGVIRWQLLLCLIAAWVLTFLCLFKGIKTSGKAVYVTATFPYLIMTIILIRGLTLEGAVDGLVYYLVPKWEKLLTFKVWGEAASQIFFSTGIGWGGLLTYASYNRFHHNCYRDSIIVVFVNSLTSLYAGLAVFCMIGYMAHQTQNDVEDVVKEGPGLAFVVYPEAVSNIPGAPFWSILFFGMLIMIGLGSQFGQIETLVSGIVDEFPALLRPRKTLFTGFVCFLEFLIGLPLITQGGIYVLQLMDWYCATVSLMVITMIECLVISYGYGMNRFCNDIALMIGRTPPLFYKICWYGVTPGAILFILVFSFVDHSPVSYGTYKYPSWAVALGWVVALASLVPLPSFMVSTLLHTRGTLMQRLCFSIRPAKDWGPSVEQYREVYLTPQNGHCANENAI